MTEGESGGKLVNKFVKEGQETVMEEEGAAVCQGWGSILLGAAVHSPNSWWGFASE